MHRRETVPGVPGAVRGQSLLGEGSQGSGRRFDGHEVRDQKIRETTDAVDKQPFPQVQRQTGELLLSALDSYMTGEEGGGLSKRLPTNLVLFRVRPSQAGRCPSLVF